MEKFAKPQHLGNNIFHHMLVSLLGLIHTVLWAVCNVLAELKAAKESLLQSIYVTTISFTNVSEIQLYKLE